MMKGGNEKSEPGRQGSQGTWHFKGDHFFSNNRGIRYFCYVFNCVWPVHGQIIGGINNDASL